MSDLKPVTIAELRAEIRKALLESDIGLPGYGADIGPLTGPGYGFFNYGGSLKNIFVDPFVDVFKTAKGVATELTTRAKAAAQIAIETILSSFIPLYETNYQAIFKQMGKSLEQVKKKYEKVYQANDEAFRDKDARFLAFLYDPSAWITAKAAESAPGAVANVLEIFTDSQSGAGSHLAEAVRYLRELQMELQGTSRYNRSVPQRLRRQAASNKHMLPWESKERSSGPILEAGEEGQMSTAQKVEQILSNPELKKEIDSSAMAQSMKIDGQKLLNGLFANVAKDINAVKSVQSFDDIQRMSHGKVQIPDMANVDPQEKEQAEQVAVSSVKQGLSEFYRRSLQGAINQAQSEGVGANNAYIRTLQNLLSKVG